MLIKKRTLWLSIALTINPVPCVFASILPSTLSNKQRHTKIASLLGWHVAPDANLCNGYYIQPKGIDTAPPSQHVKTSSTITAKGPNFLQLHGVSILRNHVIVKQPGREARADTAHIKRNKAGKISLIKLTGHVHLYENGKTIVTDHLNIELPTHHIRAHTVVYRLHQTNMSRHESMNAWGSASDFTQIKPGLTEYKNASYSTCRPLNPTWSVGANRLTLNKKTGLGTVHGAVLKIKGLPILPLPYWQFPIDDRRRSGLLAPAYSTESITTTNQNLTNTILSLPIYLNLAPNWDDTLGLNWESERGFVMNNAMRYLNRRFQSHLAVTWAPHDKLASPERATGIAAITGNPSYPPDATAGYLAGLNDLRALRYGIDWGGMLALSPSWTADWSLMRVSDDYFFRDYRTIAGSNTNLLRSAINLQYNGNHWRDEFLAESYQTLHRYDQLDYTVTSPYARQPELSLSGFYANWLKTGLDFSLPTQLVHFTDNSSFMPNLQQGTRLHARPTLSLPISVRGGEILPSLALDWRAYDVQHPNPGVKTHPSFAIPIADIDSHWTRSGRTTLFGTPTIQELTSHVNYLYIPTINQNSAPNFDSYLLPFSYAQLFTWNRYSGYDRLNPANQLSVALDDTFYDASNANELASFGLGLQHNFEKKEACLNFSCQTLPPDATTLVTDMSYALTSRVKANASAAWNLTGKALNNLNLGFQFNGSNQRLFGISYNYTQAQDNLAHDEGWINNNPSNSLGASAAWPLSKKWRVMGYYNYDFDYKRSNLAFIGVEYNACCWRFQLLFRQLWDTASLADDGSLKNTFNHRIMLTVEFKGLGDFGETASSGQLLKNIPNFRSFY